MKKIKLLFIIIFSTLISVTIMISFDYHVNNFNAYEKEKLIKYGAVKYKKPSNSIINNNDGVKVVIKDEMKDEKSNNYTSVKSSNTEITKNDEDEDSLENYYNYIDKNEKSVFRVSASKIKENLTTSDKIKLLYVSTKLDTEDYKKVQEYLYAKDAEDGVLKALKLLKKDLSAKEYDKVRKVAGRFIDMNLAEGLN